MRCQEGGEEGDHVPGLGTGAGRGGGDDPFAYRLINIHIILIILRINSQLSE